MSTVPDLASGILSGLAVWLTRKEREREREDAALRALLSALNRTKHYIAQLDRGGSEDVEVEADLVQLWQEAAVQIRRSDRELGVRLGRKADYWTNPRNWSEESVRSNGIQIDRISREAERLLSDV